MRTVGSGAAVAPGAMVGAHAPFALGVIVLRDVPAHGLVIGKPARQMGWA
ncbi:hypothetical protein OG894_43385 (plasmid) [Streptomyces sp. NBC_01724]|nr:hypothetical protein [Streptomyces sp. NBC_01724]